MRTVGGGWNNYRFIPAVPLINYRDMFTNLYPDVYLDAKHMYILDCFSEFHVRVLEQAVISYVKPEINDLTTNVSFSFPSVDIESYNPYRDDRSHPITAYTIDGEVYNEYSSIRTARRALGISEGVLTNARNRIDYFINCPTPNKLLRIFDHTINSELGIPLSSHKNILPISGIEIKDIPFGKIHAIFSNKSDLYGEYVSCGQFAKDHGLNDWQAYRYLNLERPIPISGGLISVFLCCNPDYRQYLLDVQNKST